MQIGVVGLGRMGGNIVRRLTRSGHECVVFDQNPQTIALLTGEGATGAAARPPVPKVVSTVPSVLKRATANRC